MIYNVIEICIEIIYDRYSSLLYNTNFVSWLSYFLILLYDYYRFKYC